MAFILTLDRDAETTFEQFEGNGEFLAVCTIGYDDEDGTVFALLTGLSPVPGQADIGGFELVFRIVRSEPNCDVVRDYDSGHDTKRVIPDADHRETIMAALCMSVRLVIGYAQPSVVYFTTSQPDLPLPALRKFNVICDTVRNLGYDGGRCDSYHGHVNWILRRRDQVRT